MLANILPYSRNIKFTLGYNTALSDKKIFIPINKSKNKAEIRGFWLDKNKTYYDYIKINAVNKIDYNNIDKIKKEYKQICLFYQSQNKGYVFYNKNKIEVLQDKKVIKIKKEFRGLKNKIKDLLNKYNGLTVYILENCYIIEVFY